MELVDVVDSKSTAGDSVPVRVRSPAPSSASVPRNTGRSQYYPGVAQLVARLLWEQDVASSNLVIPTKTKAAEGQLLFCIIQYSLIINHYSLFIKIQATTKSKPFAQKLKNRFPTFADIHKQIRPVSSFNEY